MLLAHIADSFMTRCSASTHAELAKCMHCRKILKKHDKMTNNELSSKMMPTVSDTLQKEQRKGALEGLKNSVVHHQAHLCKRLP